MPTKEVQLPEEPENMVALNRSLAETAASPVSEGQAVTDGKAGGGPKVPDMLPFTVGGPKSVERAIGHDTNSADLLRASGAHGRRSTLSSLKIELWKKQDKREGPHDVLGVATIPAWDTVHPAGDFWVPLESSVVVGTTPSTLHKCRGLGNAARGSMDAFEGDTEPRFGKERNASPRGVGLVGVLRGTRSKDPTVLSTLGPERPVTGSVHLWLGRTISKSGPPSQQQGNGRVIFKVYAASGLCKVNITMLHWWRRDVHACSEAGSRVIKHVPSTLSFGTCSCIYV